MCPHWQHVAVFVVYSILFFQVAVYEELARIFSEENNQWAQRELLMREGTAKFADTVGEHDKQLQKVFQKQQNNSGVRYIDVRKC